MDLKRFMGSAAATACQGCSSLLSQFPSRENPSWLFAEVELFLRNPSLSVTAGCWMERGVYWGAVKSTRG